MPRPTILPRSLGALTTALVVGLSCTPRAEEAELPDAAPPPNPVAQAVFDPTASTLGEAPPTLPQAPLAALDYGPKGRTSGGGDLHIRFNQSVGPMDVDDAPLAGIFAIDPPTPGVARWRAPDLLVFTPDEAWAPATAYSVRLAAPVVAADGQRRYEGPLEWSFETARPQVRDGAPAHPDVRRQHGRMAFYVVFDAPVSLAEARAHIRASARPRSDAELDRDDGLELASMDAPKPAAVKVQRLTEALAKRHKLDDALWNLEPDRTFLVTPQARLWPRASTITVEVREGLRSEAGPLPLDTPWRTSFATYGPQKLRESSCGADRPCPLEPIILEMRNPVLAREAKKIRVSPRPKALSIDLHDDWGEGGHEVSISGVFLPGKTYTITLPAGMRDIYGQALGRDQRIKATIAREPTLTLSARNATLLAGDARTFGVSARHLEAIEIRVGALDEATAAALLRDSSTPREWPAAVAATSKVVALQPTGATDWDERAIDLRDYVGERRGAFLVEVRPRTAVAAAKDEALPAPVRGIFRVTDLAPAVDYSLPETLVRVVRLSDGAPVAGAKLRLRDHGDVAVDLGATDVDGLAALGPSDCAFAEKGPGAAPRPGSKTAKSETAKSEPKRSDAKKSDAKKSDAKKSDAKKSDAKKSDAKKRAKGAAQRWCATARTERAIVVADTGDDVAYVDIFAPHVGDHDEALRPGERLVGRVITERGVYRPGETIHVVGWSAVHTAYTPSGLRRPQRAPVTFTLVDPRGEVILETTAKTTAEGKFSAALAIPERGALGHYRVDAKVYGATLDASLKVEDFRTPEFEVSARAAVPDVIADDGQRVHVRADYYFGGPVVIQSARHNTACRTFYYRPPGLDPRWSVGSYDERYYGAQRTPTTLVPLASRPRGAVEFPLATRTRAEGLAERCSVSVEIRDASLQGIGAEDSYVVHPAAHYLAIGRPEAALLAGDRYAVPLRGVRFDGQRVAGVATQVTVERTYDAPVYRQENGRKVLYGSEPKTEAVATCDLRPTASGDDPTCDPGVLKAGSYSVVARATIDGHGTRSAASFWVRERPQSAALYSWPAPSRLEIRTTADEVKPGDALEIHVRSPWPELRSGVLTLARAGIREHHALRFRDGDAVVKLTADDAWTPRMILDATAVRTRGASLPKIERATATVTQGFEHRRLQVAVDAPAEAGPGDEVAVRVQVRDAAGEPSAAHIAFWAVDEAVLALTSYEVPDLLPTFIPRDGGDVSHFDAFSTLRHPFTARRGDPWLNELAYGTMSSYGSGYGSGAGFGARGVKTRGPQPARSRFETTPVFIADMKVGESGVRTAKIELPDNLTTFRVLAVASARLVDGQSPGRFGVGDARLRVTQPLVLRPALPRIMRPGDSAEIAAILQNRTSSAGEVTVTLAVAGDEASTLALTSAATRTAAIEADGQVRVPFMIRADRPGTPKIELRARFTASGGARHEDAVDLPLEIAPERTLVERVAAYGTVDDDQAIAVPLRLPSAVLPGFGGVAVSTTSTLLGGVEDAVHELIHYPYGCIEQTSSRLLPLVAIANLRKTVPIDVDVDGMVEDGVARILAMQTTSGGFAYWPGGVRPDPYASAYATWVLLQAKRAGYAVPAAAFERALAYLAEVIDAEAVTAEARPLSEVRQAFAAYTLSDAGQAPKAALDRLYAARARLPVFARAFVLRALHTRDPADPRVAPLADELLGHLGETEATAHVKEAVSVDLSGVFHSDGRSDAIVLSALLEVRPDHAALPKLARGLLERRQGGAWRNTQENAYALLALADYVAIYEKETPDFVARAWVGQELVLDATFRGRDGATRSGGLGMGELLLGLAGAPARGGDLLPVILQRQGAGRLYYRIGAEWAPTGPDLPARARGLTIRRTLRTADGPLRDGQALPPGESVALDIDLRVDNRAAYVAVDVPIPAGLEAIHRDLGRGQAAMTLSGRRGGWVSYEEQRRDRVVVFADDLQPGDHHHTVHLRATTPGSYTVPPAVAEAMYTPEIYGRSTAARIDVAAP
ncbi:MAG: MG2 domain-containing protein [Nannocystaceae bacterium]